VWAGERGGAGGAEWSGERGGAGGGEWAPWPAELARFRHLIAAEAATEAGAARLDPADLEQAVWLRLLERGPASAGARDISRWTRAAARASRTAFRREVAFEAARHHPGPAHGPPDAETRVETQDSRRALLRAARRLPGRCPSLVAALLSAADPTYGEIALALGMPQGSVGPLRSRCLGCLRTLLREEVGRTPRRGKAG
jgi:DNA-directed RNA polymerase specialized sigma24 family protein